MTVRTNFDYPPIPDRRMDWSACIDGQEESGVYGRGRTEISAVVDLAVQFTERGETVELLEAVAHILQLQTEEAEKDGRNASYILGLAQAKRTVEGIW